MKINQNNYVFRGSAEYLSDYKTPPLNDAAADLIERALKAEDSPLYVVGIGAITNIASAILIEPKIINRIVVVWLGGHALNWQDTKEFNLMQDVPASRIIFDCGVPLVHIPCQGVVSHLHTILPEIEKYVRGKGAIGDYLAGIFRDFYKDHYARSKVLWDIAPIAYLINDLWVQTELIHSPLITDNVTWDFDNSRHLIRSAFKVNRDPIFRDLFRKLSSYTERDID
ncbi:nucleoside hydrolase [candidate division KSB1 bacterium]